LASAWFAFARREAYFVQNAAVRQTGR